MGARELDIAWGAMHRGEERFFDVVLGNQRKSKPRGERPRQGSFAGTRRPGNQNDAVFGCETHSSVFNGRDTGWVTDLTLISHAGSGSGLFFLVTLCVAV
jgi:hypothetical protein